AADAFQLHDTYGFPYDLTKELLAEDGLSVDDQGFEALMERQRARARGGVAGPGPDRHPAVTEFAPTPPRSHRVGHTAPHTDTATHRLHAALRERLGTHVRQAGSAVRPDKLRFDFTHGAPLDRDEVRDIEERVNAWIKASRPVRAMEMERAEAEALGAMALFGEKYGDWVRVIEVEDVSRELCGGTHVASTAEVGIFAIVAEGSSAANVRRVEAVTGPAAIDWFRARSAALDEAAALLRTRDAIAGARQAAERIAELEARLAELERGEQAKEAAEIGEGGEEIDGIRVIVARGHGTDQ